MGVKSEEAEAVTEPRIVSQVDRFVVVSCWCRSRVVGAHRHALIFWLATLMCWSLRSRLVSRVIKCRVRLRGLVQGR